MVDNSDINSFTAYFAGRHLSVSEVIEPTKLSMEDMEIKKKLDVLALADQLGNDVSTLFRTQI